jgi:hypothetical protein
MLVNKSKVREIIKTSGKRISKDAWAALDNRVIAIIQTAIKLTGGHKTITDTEVLMAQIGQPPKI